MESIPVLALAPGMELAEDVKDYRGQIVLKKGKKLDNVAIEQIKILGLHSISIMEPEDYYDNYFDKVLHSKLFSQFERLYFENFTAYKVSIDALVKNKVPINDKSLLVIIDNIINPVSKGKTTILDMLSVLRTDDKDFLYAHGLNVALICWYTASWFNLTDEERDLLILCGFYYDIGKFFVSDKIINKKGKLTDAEFVEMKKHTLLGYSLLQEMGVNDNIQLSALMHHERCDGSGYPQRLTDDKINKFAKIIAILDAYEAMTSYRSYRQPLCPFKVVDILINDGFGKYDTKYYMTFLKRIVDKYIGKEVMLNNGMTCKVVLINQHALSRPMVVMDDDKYVDLSKTKDLFIDKLT